MRVVDHQHNSLLSRPSAFSAYLGDVSELDSGDGIETASAAVAAPTLPKRKQLVPSLVSSVASNVPAILRDTADQFMMELADQTLHRLVLEGMPLGIAVANRAGKLVLWSAGAEQATGYFRQEVIGRSCQEHFLQHTDSENNALQGTALPLTAALRDGRAITGGFSLRTKSSHHFPARVWALPLRNEAGTLLGAVEIFEALASSTDERRQSKLGAFGCLDPLTGALSRAVFRHMPFDRRAAQAT